MSLGNVAWDVSVKSAAGLSQQPSRAESTTDPSPQPSERRAKSTAEVMVIDKSWTLLERHEKAFYTGLTKFVDDCKLLQRLYKSSHTGKETTWHATGKCTEPSKMQHPADGRAWKNFDSKYPNFTKEPRNVRLGLAADGFNPFGNLSQAYRPSMIFLIEVVCLDGVGKKSHDFHIMMQRLLPYGLQQYFPAEVAKPIIKLCSFFKQICSATLMEDDMLKAQSEVVDILCNLEVIYPPAFFDIMIHLVIHLPLEALEDEPIRSWWMFSFERFMKKLKGYVRNKAKPKGSIAKGYVAEEALTFKLKKVTLYVLYNSPEINAYRSQFKSKFPNKDMKEEFPDWFGLPIRQHHVDNDIGVSTSSELFDLACRPTPTAISVNHCIFNSVRFVVHSRDERRTTENYGICSPDGGVIVVEEVPDVIHFDNLFDLLLSTSLNELDNATLLIDGQSMKVDALPDIIDLDKDDDIIDDEDALPYDLADSNDEDLVNVYDDNSVDMSADVARGHGGDGGGDDRRPTHHIPTGCGGCFTNRGKGTRKPNLGGRKVGRLHTCQETQNLGLKKNTDNKGPVLIRFEWDDKKTLMPLGDHASHWSNYLGELIREVPLYYPSWQKVLTKWKAAILTKIETQFDLTPHMQSQRWTDIDASIYCKSCTIPTRLSSRQRIGL
nr:hypothetical protein [Tanacetum cinerariifolium]